MKQTPVLYESLEKGPWVLNDGSIARLKEDYELKGGAMLDIGCGSGILLKAFEGRYLKLHGIDLTSYILPDLQERITFVSVDLNFEKLPYKDGGLDLVTAFQVLEHLENPFHVMREIYRTLVPGGLFIMSVPNPFQITFRAKYFFTGDMPPWTRANDHLLFLTRAVFEKTYLRYFELLETVPQMGAIPMWGRLRPIFGKRLIKKHAMILPRSEMFGRRICYVLRRRDVPWEA